MKKILERANFIPQGTAQCQTGSFCVAVSLVLKNKYGIDFQISPEKVEAMDDSISFTPSYFLEKFPELFPKKIRMGKFQPKRSKEWILSHFLKKLIRNRAIVCQIDKWKVLDGKLQKGEIMGHWVVCYGVDKENGVLFFENPWRSEHAFTADIDTFFELSGSFYTIF